MDYPISKIQMSVLRAAAKRGGKMASARFDGRALRGLERRGLATVDDGTIRLSDAGMRTAQAAAGASPDATAPSAAASGAMDRLAAAIPAGAEVAVGSCFAYADDVVRGLRQAKRTKARRE